MIYECYQCAAALPPSVQACPTCGDAFDAPVPPDAVLPPDVVLPPRGRFRKKQVFPGLLVSVSLIAMVTAGVSATRIDAPKPVLAPIGAKPLDDSPGQTDRLTLDPATALSPNQLSAGAALSLVHSERDRFWLAAQKKVSARGLRPVSLGGNALSPIQRGVRVLHGPRGRREIALTFDDGPHPAYTPQLLKILEKNGIHATFFVVGKKAEEFPDLIRVEAAAGHSIGNHTYDHVSLDKIPPSYIATEIEATGDVVQSITGKRPTLFRPPGGVYNPAVEEIAQILGCRMILCSDNPGDYKEPGTQVIETRTLNSIDDGGIILLHDGSRQTLSALPDLIHRLKARGYHFVTVDEMLSQGTSVTPSALQISPQAEE